MGINNNLLIGNTMKILHMFKNYILVSLLILSFDGCATRVKDFKITEKSKPISDAELSKMSAKEFHEFMKIKVLYSDRVFTYTDAHDVVDRYCKSRGSDLIVYTPSNKAFLDSSMSLFLKDNYDIKYEFGTGGLTSYWGCKLYDTNEYLDFTLVSSYGPLNRIYSKVQYADTYFLELDSLNKYEFDTYLEKFKFAKYNKYNYNVSVPEYNNEMEQLRNRQGAYEHLYFDRMIYKGKSYSISNDDYDRINFYDRKMIPYSIDNKCALTCKQSNMKNNGYDMLRDTIRDKWTIQSEKDFYVVKKIDSDCSCAGVKKYIMIK